MLNFLSLLSSVDRLTLGYYTQISAVKLFFFFSLISTVSSVNQSFYNKPPSPPANFIQTHLSTHTHALLNPNGTWLEVWFILHSHFVHTPFKLFVYWVCSSSSPIGPWLRYPCHVTPKDSQRSARGGTEGPQMDLHQLALLCPSAVTSPCT